jgi:uncharacterized protein (TIGR03083 family)
MAGRGATVRAEREALAADLQAVDEAAWATSSLCSGWTVRDVLAHMTALARMTPAKFFQKLFASGFNLSRLQARDMDAVRTRDSGAGSQCLYTFSLEIVDGCPTTCHGHEE